MTTLPLALPEPQGRRLDNERQQCDSVINDVGSLLEYLKEDQASVDLSRVSSWFPRDDSVAFWTCNEGEGEGEEYSSLTYKELQEEMTLCPNFASGARVAIAMPLEEMAHTATAILATMAKPNVTAVPLGPRVTWDAIQQLHCTVLVLSNATVEWRPK